MISWRNLLILVCVVEAYISSMSEGESERVSWRNASSPEPREEIVLMLLMLLTLVTLVMLDIEEVSESSE